ncbi:hypothetical protein AB1A65_05935 [Muricauda sp. ANG21]|uniref:hypothetical protein n=1 Tax=Allomuricauda sp. ANG21 TaxID=3042468 RepID=UPI0034548183
MDLALSQVTNISPSIIDRDSQKVKDTILDTSKLSPSDIPNEVEVTRHDSTLAFSLNYFIMEGDNDMVTKTDGNLWELVYSKVTGRIYRVKYKNSSFDSLKSEIKLIRRGLQKNRLKDNLKFGIGLIEEIALYIQRVT